MSYIDGFVIAVPNARREAFIAHADAALELVSGIAVLAFAIVFVVAGWEFTEFAFNRISELAELPLWMIHIAWPLLGLSWLAFHGERMYDLWRVATGREGGARR